MLTDFAVLQFPIPARQTRIS